MLYAGSQPAAEVALELERVAVFGQKHEKPVEYRESSFLALLSQLGEARHRSEFVFHANKRDLELQTHVLLFLSGQLERFLPRFGDYFYCDINESLNFLQEFVEGLYVFNLYVGE